MYHRHREAAQSMSGPGSPSPPPPLARRLSHSREPEIATLLLVLRSLLFRCRHRYNCSSFTGLYPPLFSFFSRFLLYGILLLLRGLLELLYVQLALSIKYWAHEVVELSNNFVYRDRQRAGSFMGIIPLLEERRTYLNVMFGYNIQVSLPEQATQAEDKLARKEEIR